MTRNATDLSREESDSLVVLARRGNDQAFAELVSRHQSKLRNLLRRLSNDSALADDLAQQAFLEAWRSIKNLRSSVAFGAWLKKVAINTWLKHSRSKDPLNAVEDIQDASAIVERSLIDEEIDLDRALAALSKPERLCIVLSYHQGMSHGSIAEFTGMPLGTVKSHINRGTQQLRELLKIYESDFSSEYSGNKT
jgi:RNA polymerase sigma-70 factor (ECF subfamily)